MENRQHERMPRMKAYPEYKDSGVKWIGKVPSHWEIRRAKTMFYRVLRPVKEDDEVITCFRDGQVTLRRNRRTEGFTESLKEVGYQGIRKGDLVIHQMDAFAGSIGVSDSDGKGTPVYICCQPLNKEECDNQYYAFLLREMARKGFIKSLYRGIRERSSDFRYETFAIQLLPIPTISEQEAIVDYLDRKCSQIDKYVEEKKRQIAALGELKQVEIAEAVTHGLNPDAPMRDSGIPWIGMIPKHWEVKRLRHLCTCNDETLSETEPSTRVINYVEIGDVDKVRGITNFTRYAFREAPSRARRITRKGDVIISTVRTYLQAIAQVEQDGLIVSTGFAVIRANKLTDPQFLAFTLRSNGTISWIVANSKGISYPAITANELLQAPIPLPPLSEQQAIVAYIEEKVQSIDTLVSALEEEIAKLKELKQSIISDAVTGNVDVRDYAKSNH